MAWPVKIITRIPDLNHPGGRHSIITLHEQVFHFSDQIPGYEKENGQQLSAGFIYSGILLDQLRKNRGI